MLKDQHALLLTHRTSPFSWNTTYKLISSLADIDHGARGGGQRLLLPVAVNCANLKPIIEEQGFHLLGKDIAQGRAIRLLLLETFWRKPVFMEGVMLNLGNRVVLLLLTKPILPAIRQGVGLRFWEARFKEIAWRGMAGAKEETSLRGQVFPHARQQRFMVCSGEKVLKGIAQHVNQGKLLPEVERARICHRPVN